MVSQDKIRNIAIIAHVDHGKTTLVDELLKQGGIYRENQATQDKSWTPVIWSVSVASPFLPRTPPCVTWVALLSIFYKDIEIPSGLGHYEV